MNITDIARELEAARSDMALLARLQGAPERVATLQPKYDAALAKQAEDAAKQAEAEREASYEGVTDIRVDEVPNASGQYLSMPHTSFAITYTRPQYCMYANRTVTKEHTVRGFRVLPRGAFLFLLEKRPEQIPAKIANLLPGDPEGAFSKYFVALRRGHL